jgi:hypothetical protein
MEPAVQEESTISEAFDRSVELDRLDLDTG